MINVFLTLNKSLIWFRWIFRHLEYEINFSKNKISITKWIKSLLFIQSFVVKVPGQGSVRVNGSTMNGSAQAAIKKATRGDQVNITEIIATGPGGVKLKASPVVYEVQ